MTRSRALGGFCVSVSHIHTMNANACAIAMIKTPILSALTSPSTRVQSLHRIIFSALASTSRARALARRSVAVRSPRLRRSLAPPRERASARARGSRSSASVARGVRGADRKIRKRREKLEKKQTSTRRVTQPSHRPPRPAARARARPRERRGRGTSRLRLDEEDGRRGARGRGARAAARTGRERCAPCGRRQRSTPRGGIIESDPAGPDPDATRPDRPCRA